MSTTPSARIGLFYDSTDDGIDPQVPNFTRLDQVMPIIWVADGVTPPDAELYDGIIVGEITSGKVWAAKKNGGGTFDKRYIRYPYSAVFTGVASPASSGAYSSAGWPNLYATGKNSSAADFNGSSFWVAPIKGLYHIDVHDSWAANAAGQRAMQLLDNGVGMNAETETVFNAIAGTVTALHASVNRVLAAGEIIGHQYLQSSGGALACTTVISVAMIDPTV
jgi:hypothetical protein